MTPSRFHVKQRDLGCGQCRLGVHCRASFVASGEPGGDRGSPSEPAYGLLRGRARTQPGVDRASRSRPAGRQGTPRWVFGGHGRGTRTVRKARLRTLSRQCDLLSDRFPTRGGPIIHHREERVGGLLADSGLGDSSGLARSDPGVVAVARHADYAYEGDSPSGLGTGSRVRVRRWGRLRRQAVTSPRGPVGSARPARSGVAAAW